MPLTTNRDEAAKSLVFVMGRPGTSQEGQFRLPILEGGDALSDTSGHFFKAIDELSAFVDAVHEITDDTNLSDTGRAAKLAPLQKRAIAATAQRWALVQQDEAKTSEREAALFAVPEIAPSNAAAAILDREVRDYFRSLPMDQRAAILQKIDNEPGSHDAVMLALMRSPIALLDHESKMVMSTWRKTKREANLPEAAAIDAAKVNAEWAKRGLVTAAAVTRTLTKHDRVGVTWGDEQILGTVLTSPDPSIRKGFPVFGIDPMRAAQEQRRIDAISIRR